MAERRHKFEGLVLEMLVRSIREHRCVLFAGAGLSAQAQAQDGSRLPTWSALVDQDPKEWVEIPWKPSPAVGEPNSALNR